MNQPAGNVRAGTYILPNLLTACNLTCGILAILLVLETAPSAPLAGSPNQILASWLILAAMVFDFLDGKVARWTHSVSEFGVKVDSLTDFVTFGMAPATLAYVVLLPEISFGVRSVACGLFLAGGAWRLARFNCETYSKSSQSFFSGLPIPAAASLVATYSLVTCGAEHATRTFLDRSVASLPLPLAGTLSALLLAVLAVLMVSRVPFPAFKKIDGKNILILSGLGLFSGVLLLVLPLDQIVFFIMLLYILIGLFQHFLNRVLLLQPRIRREKKDRRSRRTGV